VWAKGIVNQRVSRSRKKESWCRVSLFIYPADLERGKGNEGDFREMAHSFGYAAPDKPVKLGFLDHKYYLLKAIRDF
jgi:hypothetical protein